jgi:DNA-binding transcriptional ArsR family regulator
MPESDFHAEHGGSGPLKEEEAAAIAEMVGALSNPPRVALLYALRRGGEMTVSELAEAAGITPSAASQQLRVLRHLRLVTARREGRSIFYTLHDPHVGALLDEIRHHVEHARLGWSSPPVAQRSRIVPEHEA